MQSITLAWWPDFTDNSILNYFEKCFSIVVWQADWRLFRWFSFRVHKQCSHQYSNFFSVFMSGFSLKSWPCIGHTRTSDYLSLRQYTCLCICLVYTRHTYIRHTVLMHVEWWPKWPTIFEKHYICELNIQLRVGRTQTTQNICAAFYVVKTYWLHIETGISTNFDYLAYS